MKRQADGQKDLQIREGGMKRRKAEELVEVGVEEIKILKKSQHPDISDQTQDKQTFADGCIGSFFEQQAGDVIDHDGEPQDQDILRHKSHVKVTTGQQQQQPPESGFESPVKNGDNDIKKNKLQRVVKHALKIVQLYAFR